MINMLSAAIFCGLFIASQQSSSDTKDACWTQWYDRDNPSGSGDWETLADLRTEHPGKICSSPTAIEFETLNGLSAAATGDVISAQDTTSGLICRNEDQPDGKTCSDYRVRFSCPDSYCDTDVCWTKWFDRDDASGTGDWETLADFQTEKPGEICPNPVDIEAQTLNGLSVADAGEVIHKRDTTTGFVCRNEDQPDGKKCSDYRVRFRCPSSYCAKHVCWTDWYDQDDPKGSGDKETLADLHQEFKGRVCKNPLSIEAVTVDQNIPAASTGDVFKTLSPSQGLECRNEDQKSGSECNDYKVRFGCTC